MPNYNDDDDRPRRSERDRDDDDRPRRDRNRDDDRDEPRRPAKKKGMSTGLIIGIVVGVLLLCVALPIVAVIPAMSKVRSAAARSQDSNNLKQIGIAGHGVADSTNQFANGPYATDPIAGSPNTGLSFRVGLLPYMEYDSIYRQFRTSEAWDSASNRPLGSTLIRPLSSPLDPGVATTRYRAFVGPGSVFEPGVKVTLMSITDGTSNTIYVVGADEGVVWSKPEELYYTATGPLPSIGQKSYPGGTNVAMCDGSVRFLSNKMPETVLRALITRNGNEELPPGGY